MVLVSKTSSVASDLNKSLKIKTDSLKRLEKDYIYYQKELEEQKNRVELCKKDPTKDEYDLKKQVEILDENNAMIVDTVKRLTDSLTVLAEFLEEQAEKKDSLDQYNEAMELMERLYQQFINE
ncbi:hypothetical protein SAMD00019534_113430 [Acytostelium subglobosum LB1]|uniref:hypothetical protein n=1 Tax=Acytostelium subglobosum LB1 TaxID=1410327 RepID=UPI000645029A|nr:hypothetical protein SAMD00019534_113430 [Acytostelium subglobosum LB1]GAM28167.1 hypothetical protein SAMD00019534_113430 [Acytostelium subglobosum LB1]|eukprot:XP_012748801.1 hypothetical protein SAMD00019534_113430 [Acytostelium subglobosum LB1]